MTNNASYKLIPPHKGLDNYTLLVNPKTTNNTASTQVGAAQTAHNSHTNCVSYDTLMALLQERAKSPQEDRLYFPDGNSVSVRNQAQGLVDYFKQNPASADLAREFLSNASCSDIASLTQSITEGTRDLTISRGAMELRNSLQNSPLARMLGLSGRRYESGTRYDEFQGMPVLPTPPSGGYTSQPTTESWLGYGGRVIKNGVEGLTYVAAALLLVAAANGTRDFYKRAQKHDLFNRFDKGIMDFLHLGSKKDSK